MIHPREERALEAGERRGKEEFYGNHGEVPRVNRFQHRGSRRHKEGEVRTSIPAEKSVGEGHGPGCLPFENPKTPDAHLVNHSGRTDGGSLLYRDARLSTGCVERSRARESKVLRVKEERERAQLEKSQKCLREVGGFCQ